MSGCFSFARRRQAAVDQKPLLGRKAPAQASAALPSCAGCFPKLFAKSAGASDCGDEGESKARQQAIEGLEEVVNGYRKIAQLALPPGAALVLANLYRDTVELDSVIAEAQFPRTRPWMLPLPDEQHDWEALYPNGGFLLRRQVCMASTGDEEWFLGGLFVSDAGVLFDTGDGPDDSNNLQTGLLPWRNISACERPGPKAEIVLEMVKGTAQFSQLRLQLSIVSDIEWIEEFWKLRSALMLHDMTIPSEHEQIRLPLASTRPRLLMGGPSSPSGSPGNKAAQLSAAGTLLQRKLSKVVSGNFGKSEGSPTDAHRLMTLESTLSGVFAESPEGRNLVQIPNEKPLCEERVYEMALDDVRKAIERNDFVTRVAQRGRQAHDVSATKWTPSKRSPGVTVRKAGFTIPLPQDFPKAVTRLVSVPTETKITAVYRLHTQQDSLVMTMQTCSHDVPCGEKFRVHQTMLFKPLPSGGVLIEKWVEIMWIASLPWTHGMLKGIIEQKTKADAGKDLGSFVSVLKEFGQ